MDGTLGEVVGEVPMTALLDVLPSARPFPDAVRASLEAVKAAQLVARERARRETRQARIVVGGVAAAVVFGGIFVWPRLHAGKAARAASVVTAAPKPGPVALAAAPVASVAEVPAMKQSSVEAAGAGSLDACRDSYDGKRWRAAATACATAFTAHPNDAKLALRVAEAEYARDHLAEAREWSQRTLALDAKQADALAILGRSEQRTGHGEAAARAFRRYLALAPRGWHATEARAALHGQHAGTRRAVPSTAISAAQPRERDEVAAPLPPAATEPAAFPLPAPAPADAP